MTDTATSPSPSTPGTPRVRMTHITKHFGGVHALEDVHFEAYPAEVHALCGENGAGKSTLMKILSGAIGGYDGQIEIEGRPARFANPREAEALGIRIIHQELNLVPQLTVAANIFLGRERRRFGLIHDRAMEREAAALFERLGAPISPRARVGDLRIGDQQMVEIARALAHDAAVLIMDEPTSALSDAEVSRLFRVIGDLKAQGTSVVYISHKMNEVFRLADRVTVLRDGRFVATAQREATNPDQVVRWMVGREIAALKLDTRAVSGGPVLEVSGLHVPQPVGSGRPALTDLTFTLHRGEVLGVAGLLGAGRTELLESLFGAGAARQSGTVVLDGKAVHFRHPAEAIAAGVALVTEDRKGLGLFDQMTVGENISLAHLRDLARANIVVDGRRERRAVSHAIDRHHIKTAGARAPIGSLSGGNQQKCILARWMLTGPRLLLLDEPTRGIDVGAKAEIYTLIRQLGHEGMGILMTSSELPELLAVCDRILVLCEGRLTASLVRGEATEERIMQAATAFLDRREPA